MSEDLEERFRAACAAYLAAAEEADKAEAAAARAAERERVSEEAADRAREELLAVVRERDAAARQGAYTPSRDADGSTVQDDREFLAHYARPVTRAQSGPLVDMLRDRYGNACIECGVDWDTYSPDCPHKVYNVHPLAPMA